MKGKKGIKTESGVVGVIILKPLKPQVGCTSARVAFLVSRRQEGVMMRAGAGPHGGVSARPWSKILPPAFSLGSGDCLSSDVATSGQGVVHTKERRALPDITTVLLVASHTLSCRCGALR